MLTSGCAPPPPESLSLCHVHLHGHHAEALLVLEGSIPGHDLTQFFATIPRSISMGDAEVEHRAWIYDSCIGYQCYPIFLLHGRIHHHCHTGACHNGTGRHLLKSVEAWRSCTGSRGVNHLSHPPSKFGEAVQEAVAYITSHVQGK
jgi:hypothetical protein